MSGKRVSFYISPELNDNLTLLSSRMGLTKSVLVDRLLSDPTTKLVELIDSLPEPATKGDVIRFRGRSKNLVNQYLRDMDEALREI